MRQTMKVTATTNFVHGPHVGKRNEEMDLPEAVAADLEKAGLVKTKAAPAPENKMAREPANKSRKQD